MVSTITVCYFHPLRPAIEECQECRKKICKYCVYRDGEKVYCPDCYIILKRRQRNKIL